MVTILMPKINDEPINIGRQWHPPPAIFETGSPVCFSQEEIWAMRIDPNSRSDGVTDIYLNKPECIINLPQWLLPHEDIEAYRSMSGLAIVEIAGRDSIAAAIKAVEELGFTELLPTYVYTGTEYGPWASVDNAVERLSRRLPDVRVHSLLILGSPGYWRALNGRYVQTLISTFGYYTPCIGCHLYLHTARIPLSVTLGNVPIISGERERHDGAVKLNQIAEALDVFLDVSNRFDVPLLLPLRHIDEGRRITDVLGFEWRQGKEQLGCTFSGNYRLFDDNLQVAPNQISTFLERFGKPAAMEIIASYLNHRVPDHLEIARKILKQSRTDAA
jgi:hypothetical protein